MGAFKAYDIRGIFGKDLTTVVAYRIGYFLPGLLGADKVLVGRDVRTSSDALFQALTAGITDAGAVVFDAGLATTPMVYWATANYGFKASVQITASHNPAEYNGFKISREDALPVGYDTGLKDLEELVKHGTITLVKTKGSVENLDVRSPYIHFIRQYQPEIEGLKIAIDCSNGMAALLVKDFFGMEPLYLYDTLDGTFPNHEPNPLEEENVEDLKKLVVSERCDLGIIFDGDADRVMFVDEKGQFIRPDIMIGVLGHYFRDMSIKGNVVLDIRSSKAVESYLTSLGFECHLWRVGRAFAVPKLRTLNAPFGGELAGHYYLRDFYFSDSAFLAVMMMLRVIHTFHKRGISLSQLVGQIQGPAANSGEINFRIEQKKEAMELLKFHFTSTESYLVFMDFDGYRIEFKDWWFNVRPSNTEPYLRFLAEASNKELLAHKLAEVRKVLEVFH